MNCQKCGAPLEEGDRFCKNCGAAVEVQPEQSSAQTEQQPAQMGQVSEAAASTQPTPIVSSATISSNNMATPTVQTPKTNSNVWKYVVFGALAVLAIIIAVVITVLVMNGGDKAKDSGIGNVGVGAGAQNEQSTYTAKYGDFSLKLPDDWLTEEYDDYLMISDESGEWAAVLEIGEGTFSRIKTNRAQLQLICEDNGFTCDNIQVKSYGGKEFVTMEASASGQTMLIAYSDINARYFSVFQIMTVDNEADYELLELLAPVAQSITYGTSSNKVTVNNKLNLSDINALAQ